MNKETKSYRTLLDRKQKYEDKLINLTKQLEGLHKILSETENNENTKENRFIRRKAKDNINLITAKILRVQKFINDINSKLEKK